MRLGAGQQLGVGHGIFEGHHPQIKTFRPPRHSHAGKAAVLQGLHHDRLGKATLVRHVHIARSDKTAMPPQDVKRRDGPRRRVIGHVQQLVLGDELAHALHVWAGQHQKALGLEHAQKLFECHGDFMRPQMLDVVAGKNSVHAGIGHGAHVRHRAHKVRGGVGVDVKAHFAPSAGVKACGGFFLSGPAAAYVQESVAGLLCGGGGGALREREMLIVRLCCMGAFLRGGCESGWVEKIKSSNAQS